MECNDVLRRLRYALDLDDPRMGEIFELAGQPVEPGDLRGYLKKEEEEGFMVCGPGILRAFLDGLITKNRGPREDRPGPGGAPSAGISPGTLNNNQILKKLRIALELQEEDMLGIFQLGEFPLSKAELSALFRKEGHRNYKPCGDQLLKKFLKGLTVKHRGIDPK